MGDNPGYSAGLSRLGQKRKWNSGKMEGEFIRRPSRASAEILPLLFLTTFLSPPVFFGPMFLLLISALPGAPAVERGISTERGAAKRWNVKNLNYDGLKYPSLELV